MTAITAWLTDRSDGYLGQSRLPWGLLGLRLVLALYLAQWAWLQWQYPEAAVDVYQRWYGIAPALGLTEIVGLGLLIASLAMAVGLLRVVSFGIGVLFMAAMVLGLTPHLLNPYGFHQPPNWINHGLIAQVPALAGYVALFMLRRFDRLSFDGRSAEPVEPPVPGDATVAQAMLIMRITCGIFFLQWGIEKFAMTEMSVGMMERWYGVTFNPVIVTYAAGVFQITLAAAFFTGTLPRLTYAIGGLIKFKTCLAIAMLLLFPFATQSGGRLSTVAASLPVLAVLWTLYALRAWDTISLKWKNVSKSETVISH